MACWNASSAVISALRRAVAVLTGLNMLQILECRFDNVVYRMGLADNRAQARQIVNHGHFHREWHQHAISLP